MFVLTTSRVQANATNNPIFPTFDAVQQMIANAIAPLLQRISNLENNQSSQSKTIHVFDKNGIELGIYMSDTHPIGEGSPGDQRMDIFVPSINKRVSIGTIYSLSTANITSPHTTSNNTGYNRAFFTTTDCSGTPYLFVNPQTYPEDVYVDGVGNYYVVDKSATYTNILVKSVLEGAPIPGFDQCINDSPHDSYVNETLQNVMPAQPFHDLPFSDPIALPLQFKYQ